MRGTANPAQNVNVGSFMGPVFVYADIDTYSTLSYNDAQIVGLDSNKVRDPTKVWKVYYGCKALSKSQNVPW